MHDLRVAKRVGIILKGVETAYGGAKGFLASIGRPGVGARLRGLLLEA
jgi:hypothetical protein